MATTFTFSRTHANTPGRSVSVSSPQDTTVTAVVDDGAIDVGDLVTFSGFSGSAPSRQSEIQDGDQVYYLGRLDLQDGTFGYIFSKFPTTAEAVVADASFVMMTDTDDFLSSAAQNAYLDFLTAITGPGQTLPNLETEPACFLEGTLIKTVLGEVKVEQLSPGDMLLTPDGREIPVMFIGRQTVGTPFGVPERLRPVRISTDALGRGIPRRDLTVTCDHALLVDGLLINAGALVNGEAVAWAPLQALGPMFRVFHIETNEHDVILAEGCPAETLHHSPNRSIFENFTEYKTLYPSERALNELPYPRISSARLVPSHVRERLLMCRIDETPCERSFAKPNETSTQVPSQSYTYDTQVFERAKCQSSPTVSSTVFPNRYAAGTPSIATRRNMSKRLEDTK